MWPPIVVRAEPDGVRHLRLVRAQRRARARRAAGLVRRPIATGHLEASACRPNGTAAPTARRAAAAAETRNPVRDPEAPADASARGSAADASASTDPAWPPPGRRRAARAADPSRSSPAAAAAADVDDDDDGETCAICLVEFEDDERIKVLRCEHAFHAECIDPWLHRHNVCPMCKQRVIVATDAGPVAAPDPRAAAPAAPDPGAAAPAAPAAPAAGGRASRATTCACSTATRSGRRDARPTTRRPRRLCGSRRTARCSRASSAKAGRPTAARRARGRRWGRGSARTGLTDMGARARITSSAAARKKRTAPRRSSTAEAESTGLCRSDFV